MSVFLFFSWPLLHSISANPLPNWCMEHFSEDVGNAKLNDIFFIIKSSSQSAVLCQMSPSQQFSWVRVHLSAFRSTHLLRFKVSIKASLHLCIGYHGSLAFSPSYIPHHTVCISPNTPARVPFPSLQPPIVFRAQKSGCFFFVALPSCFSCCLVCRPCFIWFSLPVTRHSTRTATVRDRLSAS